ncbi:MAG: hypothetical protein JO328_05765 [Hyphomicrobiales bacterium]|nr:hypothetical protein [Hyphomicrobiales bacterium]MBV8826860.1 hypothetical protein [Hyphomicrobiales bacterium]
MFNFRRAQQRKRQLFSGTRSVQRAGTAGFVLHRFSGSCIQRRDRRLRGGDPAENTALRLDHGQSGGVQFGKIRIQGQKAGSSHYRNRGR